LNTNANNDSTVTSSNA